MTDIAKAAQESSDLALWQAYCEKKMALEDAADEIERLRAECQRLAGEVSRAHRDALGWMERAAALRTDRARGVVGRVPAGEDDVINNATGETTMIDQLTIAQAREIARMFGATVQASPAAPHPFVGRYVILRCQRAGVHAGWLVSQSGDQAVLRDSRRLWRWHAAGGIALSGVAVHGIVSSKSKLDAKAPEIALTGVIETIPCSDVAQESIANG